MMNNLCDTEWFESEDVFNIQLDGSWKTVNHKIIFPKDKDWKDYIELKKLEITCGETPYLVSRYDAITGIPIDIRDRIGILDRKLRVVNENTYNENEWFKWTVKSYCRTYGYEFQGDNLLIGRVNLLLTYMEYLKDRWNREPCTAELILILDIISWNIWQMDGLSGCVPFDTSQKCEIYDWS
jgi:hypothetical protein